MSITIKRNESFAELVNFKRNQNEPIHRWFTIKEGYSRMLVLKLIDDLKIQKGRIIDFFNGSGTSCLSAKERGYSYYGFEINPFLYLLSQVKLSDYTNEEIKEIEVLQKEVLKNYKKNLDYDKVGLSIAEKVFKDNLEDLLKIRKEILKIKKKKIRKFFIIAMCSIFDEVSHAKKDGNGLKYPENKKVRSFPPVFIEKVALMLLDLKKNKKKNQENSKVVLQDSRNLKKQTKKELKESASLVVFSPPYANCFDYTEIYKLELWLSGCVKEYGDLKKIRNNSLSSHLNKNFGEYYEHNFLKRYCKKMEKKKNWSNKIIKMINEYFFDMEKTIKMSYYSLKKGGYCAIVVGNSAYSGNIIKTDEIFSKIAKKIGFREVEINIARKLRSSSQQAKILKKGENLRESIIIMKK